MDCDATVMGGVSTFATLSLRNLLIGQLGLPALTFPFQVVTWMWLLAAYNSAYFPVNGNVIAPSMKTAITEVSGFTTVSYNATECALAVFRNISEVVFLSNGITGGVILLGLLISSPWACFCAVIASILSLLTALGFGAAADSVHMGMWGFNAVLTGIALGHVFWRRGVASMLMCVWGSVLSTIAYSAIASLLGPVGLPTLTFPFTGISWLLLLSRTSIPGLHPITIAPSKVMTAASQQQQQAPSTAEQLIELPTSSPAETPGTGSPTFTSPADAIIVSEQTGGARGHVVWWT